jgi:hypothetical protein
MRTQQQRIQHQQKDNQSAVEPPPLHRAWQVLLWVTLSILALLILLRSFQLFFEVILRFLMTLAIVRSMSHHQFQQETICITISLFFAEFRMSSFA